MKRWTALLLMFGLIGLAIHDLSAKIEQDVHSRVVAALAEEGLSEVQVQVDGKNVLLSGPSPLIKQADKLIQTMPEAGVITTQVKTNFITEHGFHDQPFILVLHPQTTYWPVKKTHTPKTKPELLITKVQQSVEVNGSVPNHRIQQALLVKIVQLADIPANLFDVTVNKMKETPDWYESGFPLMNPFIQWVENGHIQYIDNKIMIDGTVASDKARKALESAIADIPSQFLIENKLRLGAVTEF